MMLSGQSHNDSMRGQRLIRLTTIIGVIVAVVTLIIVLGDINGAGNELSDIRWLPLIVMVAIALVSYCVRFARWHRLLSIAAGSPSAA